MEIAAKVRGEPLAAFPTDLYIPPDALSVYLETFEGPLDLLLYLIRKNSLDVLDIPMAQLTRQYLEYVDAMQARHFELAAEYLLMAAVLIDIKSRLLLPRPPAARGEEADPRAELVRRLLVYEQMKRAAQTLGELPMAGRDFSPVTVLFDRTIAARLPEVRIEDLHAAWLAVIARARVNRHHTVMREELSVREQMSRILRNLRVLGPGMHLQFVDLFEPVQGVPGVVVAFLAVLELAKEGLVRLVQTAPFAPIHVSIGETVEATS